MKRNKKILSIFVLLIVFAFIASFFSMVAFSNNGDEEKEEQTQDIQQVEEVSKQVEEVVEEPSDFIKSVQTSMVVSDDKKETAQSLVNTINIYNTLAEDNKVISFDGIKDDFSSAKKGLEDMDIYFNDIDSSFEKSVWELVLVDENGIATLNNF